MVCIINGGDDNARLSEGFIPTFASWFFPKVNGYAKIFVLCAQPLSVCPSYFRAAAGRAHKILLSGRKYFQ